MAKVFIGSETLQIDEFAAIVAHRAKVVLDTAALSNVRRFSNSAKPLKSSVAPIDPTSAGAPLTKAECRAAILCKLVAIMQGRSGVRGEVAEYLASLLNSGVTPSFPCSEALSGVNAEVLVGTALSFDNTTISSALASIPDAMPAPGVKNDYENATLSELLASPGLLAVAVTAIRALLPTADAAAALSCEAIMAVDAPFGDAHSEKVRPHNGQVISAENLRMLLTDSRNLTAASPTTAADPPCIRCIHQFHGPAYDISTQARLVARTEVNAAPAGPADSSSSSGGGFLAIPTITTASALITSICPVAANILYRMRLLQKSKEANSNTLALIAHAEKLAESIVSSPAKLSGHLAGASKHDGIAIARALSECASTLQSLIAAEVSAASGVLSRRKEVMAAEAAEAEKLKAAKAAEMAAKFGNDDKKNKKEKEGKKPKSKGLVLGLGTRLILDWVEERVEGGDATDSLESFHAIVAAFDPYNADPETGISGFVTAKVKEIASGGVKRKPTVAKGARDFLPHQMQVRSQAFDIIRSVFANHGAVEIDTPVFENRSTLMDKYGEDQKLIYELADQGGEQLALRYDLTVPFARFLATNPVGNIKRFHISKVYRRDQPQMKRGRFREFYQCDYDVAGTYQRMIPDAEVLCVGCEILSKLPLGGFQIKLNHRQLLDGMLEICGVPPAKYRSICSAIDKLDKMPWEEVKSEMVDLKGIAPEVADKIGKFVQLHGDGKGLYKKLVEEKEMWFGDHEVANKALEDLRLLFDYLDSMGHLDKIKFDLSLARGLDYYTGVIYEAVLTSPNQVGSIAAGGRYDKLVGMFSESDVPCVGISIGVERVFAILEDKLQAMNALKVKPVSVLVISADKGPEMMLKRMNLASELWSNGISASFLYSDSAPLKRQLDTANEDNIRWCVIFGTTEVASKTVNIKDMKMHSQVTVKERELVAKLKELGVDSSSPAPLLPADADIAPAAPEAKVIEGKDVSTVIPAVTEKPSTKVETG